MKKFFFFTTSLFLPLLFFLFLEILLRVSGFGTDYPLFFKDKNWITINPNYPQKFFGRFDATSPQLIEQKFPVRKDSHTVRLVCLGGSTTAGFPFEVNINFPVFVKQALQRNFPEKNWQVVNLGISALNSQGVRHMIPEVLKLQPDVVLIYMGHNEFYGVFGPASAKGNFKNPTAVQWFLKLKTLRIYQALEALFFHLLPTKNSRQGTLMARMVKVQRVVFDGPVYRQTMQIFSENLNHILETLHQHHVPVVLAPVVCNLKDQAPLGDGQPEKNIPQFKHIVQSLEKRQFQQALSLLQEALQSHPRQPMLHYLLGQVYVKLKQFPNALRHFKQARDYDHMPFRAPEAINRIIDSLALKYGLPLAPTDSLFLAAAPDHLPGQALFLEHVHPNEKGYRLLAQAFLRVLQPLLFKRSFTEFGPEQITFSELDLAIGQLKIEQLVKNPPFNGRSQFKPRVFKPERIVELARRHLEGALLWDAAHFQLGDFYFNAGQYDRALKEFQVVWWVDSTHLTANYKIGDVYFKLGQLSKTQSFYQRALRNHPKAVFVRAKLAQILLLSGNVQQALVVIKQIVENEQWRTQLSQKQQANVLFLQALALIQLNEPVKAQTILQQVLSIDPTHQAALQLKQQLHFKEE